MDANSELTYKLFRIRKTLLSLCNDRNYIVSPEELEQTLDQFIAIYGDHPLEDRPKRTDLNGLVCHKNDPDGMFCFCFVFLNRFFLMLNCLFTLNSRSIIYFLL